MKEFFSFGFLLSLVSYFFLGLNEEVVLFLATFLFLGLLVTQVQKIVLTSLKEQLHELEKSYLFLFLLSQSRTYLNYFSILSLRSFFHWFFDQFLFFFVLIRKWLIIM